MSGHVDGPGGQALFQNPGILAAGPSGTVYIVDGPYLRVMDASANVSTLYAALPSDITAMAVDNAGNAYMAEKLVVTNLLFWQVDEITASGAFSIIVSNQTGTVYSLATSPNGLLYINYVYATGGPAMNTALVTVNQAPPRRSLP